MLLSSDFYKHLTLFLIPISLPLWYNVLNEFAHGREGNFVEILQVKIMKNNIVKQIESGYAGLRKSEKQAADYILDHLDEASAASCILRSPADTDAFQSGRCAEHNGRPETLAIIN